MKLIDYITVDIDSNDRVVGIELCDYLATKVQKLSGEKKYIREKSVQKYLSLEYHLIRLLRNGNSKELFFAFPMKIIEI